MMPNLDHAPSPETAFSAAVARGAGGEGVLYSPPQTHFQLRDAGRRA
jgi:hypothetical protein